MKVKWLTIARYEYGAFNLVGKMSFSFRTKEKLISFVAFVASALQLLPLSIRTR